MKRFPKWGLIRFFLRDLYHFIKSYIQTHYDLDGIPIQTCQMCGTCDGYDFHVPDLLWKKVTRQEDGVLCLKCFDKFATERNVDYMEHLTEMCFVGEKHSMLLMSEWRSYEQYSWKKSAL